MAKSNAEVNLAPMERFALALGRATQENPAYKRLQYLFLRYVTKPWVTRAVGPRVYADNVDYLIDWQPERGVVLSANHRSFFDQWVAMLCMYQREVNWPRRIFFPVRSTFFYETLGGLFVNWAIGGGVMYPPIFRDRDKAELTKDALDRTIEFLAHPGTLVGLHPEGTRNKGSDPYDLLPAQPGIGQIVLQAKAAVVPVFVNGLGNSFTETIVDSYRKDARRHQPVIVVFGKPVDYSEYTSQKPRVALYKKTSDLIRERIIDLMPREKQIREQCESGEIATDDPGWIL